MALDKEQIADILFYGDATRIEYWEYCEIDNDGATPYMSESQFALLKADFIKRRDELAKEQ